MGGGERSRVGGGGRGREKESRRRWEGEKEGEEEEVGGGERRTTQTRHFIAHNYFYQVFSQPAQMTMLE